MDRGVPDPYALNLDDFAFDDTAVGQRELHVFQRVVGIYLEPVGD